MIPSDKAKGGLLVAIKKEQPTRPGRTLCAGRRGELMCPFNGSEIHWHVMVYPKGNLRGRIEVFDLAELEDYAKPGEATRTPRKPRTSKRKQAGQRLTDGAAANCFFFFAALALAASAKAKPSSTA